MVTRVGSGVDRKWDSREGKAPLRRREADPCLHQGADLDDVWSHVDMKHSRPHPESQSVRAA
jgi:hypothetical protein